MLLPFRLAALRFAGSSYARHLANRHLRPMELAVVAACLNDAGPNDAGLNDNDANAYRSTANYPAILDLPAFDHAAPMRPQPQVLSLRVLNLVHAGGRS